MTLLEKTRQLLANRPRNMTLQDIEAATGISESWLRVFSRGKISDPSVNKVQVLFEHLTGSKLKVD